MCSAPKGLSGDEDARRLREHGPDELRAANRISPRTILLERFKNVLIMILLAATLLSAFLGHGIVAVPIAVIVLFAVGLGFAQEFRAGRAIDALREMAAPTAPVLRDGAEHELPARDLVPGDVVLLRAGNRVPADSRLIDAISPKAQEAALTGEFVPVEKNVAALASADLPLGGRGNMVCAGTVATYGRGRAMVVETAMQTEFGRIAGLLRSADSGKTPLQANLGRLERALARAAFVVMAIIVALGRMRGQPFVEMLVLGIALAVAVVPESLAAVVTISLALGVQRLVRRNTLVRRLAAIETLGSTSVICTDKTGTFTRDEMTARRVYVAGEFLDVSGTGYEPMGGFSRDEVAITTAAPLERLLRAAVLASDAHLVRKETQARWQVKGDPTEGALVALAAKPGLNEIDLDALSPRVNGIPFSSESKRMTRLHATTEGVDAYSKGDAEVILGSCRRQSTLTGDASLDAADRISILDAERQMASGGLRVLAIACKPGATLEEAESGMTFLWLVGMIDPPRAEAKAAIETCVQAGIRVAMITATTREPRARGGDHRRVCPCLARAQAPRDHGAAEERQLRVDRRGGGRRAWDLRKHREVPDVPALLESR